MIDDRLGRKAYEMLDRIARADGRLLAVQIEANGADRVYDKLRRLDLVAFADHPTVKDGPYPARALVLTDAGRAALAALVEKWRAKP